MSWSFSNVWNTSLVSREPRKVDRRDYIWASELGGSYIDRLLKMKGVEPTNPPNNRSLRKFEAGNLFEWVVELVLRRAGVLHESQKHLKYQYDGLLEVTGRLDHLAGGTPDWKRAKSDIKDFHLPEVIEDTTNLVIETLSEKYPNGLKNIIIEVKSVASNMFHRYEDNMKAQPHHELQLFHYLKASGMDEGHIIYISKDDLCMVEIPVFATQELEGRYKEDIENMTKYFRTDAEPEKEKPILFDTMTKRFSVNWRIPYSNYLSLIYGYKDQKEFDDIYRKKIAQWNRVLGRVADGKKMTKLNLEVLGEIEELYEDAEKIFKIVKKNEPET